jgi:hypothetical protein
MAAMVRLSLASKRSAIVAAAQVALAERDGLAVALAERDPGERLQRDRMQQRRADLLGDLDRALGVAFRARKVLGDGIPPAPASPRATDEEGAGGEARDVHPAVGEAPFDELVGAAPPGRAGERARVAAAEEHGVGAQSRDRTGVTETLCDFERLEVGVERLVAVHRGMQAAGAQLERAEALVRRLGERERAIGEPQAGSSARRRRARRRRAAPAPPSP